MKYQIDIKVYVSVPTDELPLRLPDSVFDHSYDSENPRFKQAYPKQVLRRGYISPVVECSEEDLDRFYEWAAKQSDIKIIGSTEIEV